jgi:hypothetical protein
MWLAIIAIVDKILGMLGALVPWWIKRSDESKAARAVAQKEMNDAVKANDLDAYWNARARKRRA